MTSKATNSLITDKDSDELQRLLDEHTLPAHQYKLANWCTYITLIMIFLSALGTCIMTYQGTINWYVCFILLSAMWAVGWMVWDEHSN